MASTESRVTVILALTANAVIATAKLIVGAIGGSSAMLAEGAHSVADTLNQAFLLTSLHRSDRPADARHPFGYGAEVFFWSLLAAVGIFVTGAAFSVYEGVSGLLAGGHVETRYGLTYAVLGIGFLAEGASWLRSVYQLRGEAQRRGRDFVGHLRRSHDPTVKTVFSEDSAALIGLALAAAGIGLHQLTGQRVWDSLAAIIIGLLLAAVAIQLGRDSKDALIGEAADPELRQALWRELMDEPEVDAVVELLTMHLGAEDVLLAVRLDLADGLDSDDVEDVSSRIARDIRARHSDVAQVFLDATQATPAQRRRAVRRRNGGW